MMLWGCRYDVAVHGPIVTSVQARWLSSNRGPAGKGRITALISRFGVAKISATMTAKMAGGLDGALSEAMMRGDSLDDSADGTVAAGFEREQIGISCGTACRDDSE
jgi:hypothetical protein